LKLFDYKASGLAIVASGEKGAPTCIADGLSGLVVPPCDLDALEDALHKLVSNLELRIKLGKQARLEAEAMHTWDHTAQKLEEVLIEVVRKEKEAIRRRAGAEVSSDG
jgi:phosphatidylinositol alpha 1,6-mannosyltransferase